MVFVQPKEELDEILSIFGESKDWWEEDWGLIVVFWEFGYWIERSSVIIWELL